MTNCLAILALLILTGCAPSLAGARAAIDQIDRSYNALEPALEKQRTVAGSACFDAVPPGDPSVASCLAAVRARWKPVEDAVVTLFALLTAVRTIIGTAEGAAAVGHAPNMPCVLAGVEQVLDAAERLESAVGAVHSAASSTATPSRTTSTSGSAP